MTRRIVITGIGLITPLGIVNDIVWERLINGYSGIKSITKFDTSKFDSKIAGQVPTKEESKEYGFDPKDWIPEMDIKKMDYFIHYGIAAATLAIKDSGLMSSGNKINHERIGVMIGSGIGGLPMIEKTALGLYEKGPRRGVSPFFVPASLINLVSGHVSILYGFQGPVESTVSACATGAHAICNSARIIKCNEADVMIAGGAESAISTLGVAGFCAARALSTNFNHCPETASRPWDKDRDGFVIGEGAGVVVLEEYNYAKNRNAKIYAELLGYGSAGDAYHMTSPHPQGLGGKKTMELALKNANLDPQNIDYINAHGTSTPLGDVIEAKAIKEVFQGHDDVPVSSTKSSIGHLLGAAGSVEAIFSIFAINNGIIPPTLNLHSPSEGCDLNFVPLVAQEKKIQYVLSNSFGFGGSNSSLIFGKAN